MKAVALTRVSTDRQKRLSPKIQEQRIRQFCRSQGWAVSAVFSDVQSGRDEKRDGLAAAMELACREGLIIVVYDSTRLFRNARQALNTFDHLKAHGAACVSVTDGLDTRDTSPFAKLMRTFMCAIGEYFSDYQGLRIAESNRATVARLGYRTNGSQPYGWKIAGGKRVAVPQQQSIIERIRSYPASVPCVQIAAILNQEGLPAPRGGVWRPGTVWRLRKKSPAGVTPAAYSGGG